MNNLTSDIGFYSLIKYHEELCGDHVEVIEQDENSYVIVLADGLGSGVKASILSTLTSKIISTMMANNMKIEDCVATIAATLPVCEVRQVAYSTFTIIHIVNNETAEIFEYDNPKMIFIRDGKVTELERTSMKIQDKIIYRSSIKLMEDDTFITFSDGVIHAGVGKTLNFGWERKNVIEFIETIYNKEFSAKTISTVLLDKCRDLYENEPGDDTTVCTIKIRKRCPVNLVFGPPLNENDDGKMLAMFFAKEGKHIVSGGTTSKMVAKYLNKPVVIDTTYVSQDIPPSAHIEGVDYVSEGVITINQVLQNAKNYLDDNSSYNEWSLKKDAASTISRILFEEATDINFYVGRAINPAHQNPELPINFNIKMHLVEELSECLKKMGKRINVSYF